MIAALCLLAALPTVDASFTVGASVRRLNWRDRLSPTLGPWQSGALPEGGLSLQLYPSTGRLPVVDDIGAYGWFTRSLQSETLTADGLLAFETRDTRWETGLRWRIVSRGMERGALSVGYGSLKTDFTGAQLPGFLLPAGLVQYWRPGGELKAAAGPVAFSAGAGYLGVVRQDFLARWFPRAAKGGVDGFLRASTEVGRVAFTLTARYQRFFYSLRPEPYDPYIAGGALDELFEVDLGCGARL